MKFIKLVFITLLLFVLTTPSSSAQETDVLDYLPAILAGRVFDNDGDGYSEVQGDCVDSDATIYPSAIEICGDGIDQDCDGGDAQCLVSCDSSDILQCTSSNDCNNAGGYWWSDDTCRSVPESETVYDGMYLEGVYLAGRGTNIGVILCHGRGAYPTWLVVDPLRKGINEQLGYHTLSIQMPKGNISWDQYYIYFPNAYQRIEAAIQFLQQEKGVEKIFLMGHSMGSRMATAFLANYPNSGISGFIGVGIRNNGGIPLDSNLNLRSVTLPVVDIYGNGGDGKDAVHASTRSDMVSNRYQQILVPGADHVFTQLEDEMVTAVVDWLMTQ